MLKTKNLYLMFLLNICIFFSFIIIAIAEDIPLSKQFVDISQKHWAYSAIVDMVDNYKIIGGFPDHTFRGNKQVNRFELIVSTYKMLTKLEKLYNINLKASGSYNIIIVDVPVSHWAYPAVQETINSYHVPTHEIKGGMFGGEEAINRYELAYTLVNLLQLIERTSNKIIDAQIDVSRKLQDLDENFWAASNVKLALDRYGVMNAFEDVTFRGTNPVTRYELVASFEKIAQIIAKLYGK